MVLARDILAARARFGPQVLVYDDLGQVPAEARIDAVINLAGAPTIGGLWTRARKARLLGSRLAVTGAVVDLIGRLARPPRVLLSASAVGFYGDRGEAPLTESAQPQPGRFLSDCCRLWEARALEAEAAGVRVALLRLGMVLSWTGGPLQLLALPARFGLGVVMGAGRQRFPWIHLSDVTAAVDFALNEERLQGPVNLVAPQDITQAGFARALAGALHRPQWLAVPAPVLRAALGEFADMFLASQRAAPARLTALGFRFGRPDLATALARDVRPAAERPFAAGLPGRA
jgi:hypothetical protein